MKPRSILRTLFAGCAVLMGTACADAEPMAPVEIAPAFDASGVDVASIARFNTQPNVLVGMAWKWIGPAGGSLRLLDFELVVPPGAVATDTRFTIRLPVDPKAVDHAFAEFGPHGTTFATPVIVRTPLRGTSAEGSTPRVLWWSGSEWVPFETVVTADGRIETKTTHFSTYGTEEPSRGITVAGG